MKRKIKLLSVLILLMFGNLFAQQPAPATKITIFKPEDNKPVSASEQKATHDFNLVKWNYSLLGRGVFILEYERYLKNNISAEVGFGVTTRDYIFELSKISLMDPNSGMDKYSGMSTGYAVDGGLCFYPKGFEDFDGVSLAATVLYRDYKLGDPLTSFGGVTVTNTSFQPGYSFVDLQLKVCYRNDWWWSDLYTEFYLGFAYRSLDMNLYKLNEVNDPLTNTISYNVSTDNKKDHYIQVLAGVKIGIPF